MPHLRKSLYPLHARGSRVLTTGNTGICPFFDMAHVSSRRLVSPHLLPFGSCRPRASTRPSSVSPLTWGGGAGEGEGERGRDGKGRGERGDGAGEGEGEGEGIALTRGREP